METVSKRFTWSQAFSFGALGLILISAIFKVLHLQFAGEVLLLSFAFMAGSLLTGSISGIFLYKGKKGAVRVVALILGIILLLLGFSLRLLHMPAGDEITIMSVVLLVVSLISNSLYAYKDSPAESNLLTYLHEKYTPAIERFFLFLLFPLLIYKGILILMGTSDFLGNIMLLIVSFGAGLHLIGLTWRVMEKNPAKRNVLILTATMICCLCLVLPFLALLLPWPVRIIVIALFSPIGGWLAYTMAEAPRKPIYMVLAGLLTAVFLGWSLIRLSVIPSSSSWLFFNIPILLVLVAGVLISKKHSSMRAFMLVSVAGYLFEYILQQRLTY